MKGFQLMRRKIIFSIVVAMVYSSVLTAQNVGIGIASPQEKLHVGGASSTIRIDGLSSSGTVSYTGTNILFCDANGNLTRIAPASAFNSGYFWSTLGTS